MYVASFLDERVEFLLREIPEGIAMYTLTQKDLTPR